MLSLENEIISSFLFLFLCVVFILLYIAFSLRGGAGGSKEKVVEKHFIGGKKGESDFEIRDGESPEDHEKRVKDNIALSNRWQKDVETKVDKDAVGKKGNVDGKESLEAVDLMRQMNKKGGFAS